jgi:hypothetical protein
MLQDTLECQYLIFWPQIQSIIHYRIAKPEPNQRGLVDCLALLAHCYRLVYLYAICLDSLVIEFLGNC